MFTRAKYSSTVSLTSIPSDSALFLLYCMLLFARAMLPRGPNIHHHLQYYYLILYNLRHHFPCQNGSATSLLSCSLSSSARGTSDAFTAVSAPRAASHRFEHAQVRNLCENVPNLSRPLNSGMIVEHINIPVLVCCARCSSFRRCDRRRCNTVSLLHNAFESGEVFIIRELRCSLLKLVQEMLIPLPCHPLPRYDIFLENTWTSDSPGVIFS